MMQVTHSAHYFQELYEFAVQLIQSGNAYVDHQTPEEIKQFRWAITEVQDCLQIQCLKAPGCTQAGVFEVHCILQDRGCAAHDALQLFMESANLRACCPRLPRGNLLSCMCELLAARREERRPSPHRDRPIEESLQLFEDMKHGVIDEGSATLRCAAQPFACEMMTHLPAIFLWAEQMRLSSHLHTRNRYVCLNMTAPMVQNPITSLY